MHSNKEMVGVSNMKDVRFTLPVIHGFLTSLHIPASFLKRMESQLDGRPLQTVVLMSDHQPHRHWLVTIQGGRHFKDGWKEFCDHLHLRVGDFLVFTHKTHFIFHVTVYDPITACPRLYPYTTEPSKICKSNSVKTENMEIEDQAEVDTNIPSEPGQFLTCHVTVSSYSHKSSILYLPRPFTRRNGLINRRCFVKILDERNRHWEVKLKCKNGDKQSYLTQGGLKDFLTANDVKPNSVLTFQLIDSGKTPVFRCSLRPAT